MKKPLIKIREIIVQGKYGQTSRACKNIDPSVPNRPVIIDDGSTNPMRLEPFKQLINVIATEVATGKRVLSIPPAITRVITDEFSFYPDNRPFTLDEYKEIIHYVNQTMSRLPANIHFVLATFPVIWPDGGIHNCALYAQSPLRRGEKSIIHHLSKKLHSHHDFSYQVNNQVYPLTSDMTCRPEQSPNVVLCDTDISVNDINQYHSAIKIHTSDGRTFITTTGICLDHMYGVDREQTHGLIAQLQKAGQQVPLYCSHVITSASIQEYHENVISTISHADPDPFFRFPPCFPARSGCDFKTIATTYYSNLEMEEFEEKCIGSMHGDLFQHVVANRSIDQVAASLNMEDSIGNTCLHDAFEDADFNCELIAKRVYSMVLYGGNPSLYNDDDKSSIDLAGLFDWRAGFNAQLITFAIVGALIQRTFLLDNNRVDEKDGYSPLTRVLNDSNDHAVLMPKMAILLMQSANPYVKDGHGQSAIDRVEARNDMLRFCSETTRRNQEHFRLGWRSFNSIFFAIQNGHPDVIVSIIDELETHGINLNRLDRGASLAHVIAFHGHALGICRLAKYRVDLNALDDLGFPPIFIAVIKGHADVVRELVRYGNAQTTSTISVSANALRGFVKGLKEDILMQVTLFIQNKRDPILISPMDLACMMQHQDVLGALSGATAQYKSSLALLKPDDSDQTFKP